MMTGMANVRTNLYKGLAQAAMSNDMKEMAYICGTDTFYLSCGVHK